MELLGAGKTLSSAWPSGPHQKFFPLESLLYRPKAHVLKMEKLSKSLIFNHCHIVEAINGYGGIALFQKEGAIGKLFLALIGS